MASKKAPRRARNAILCWTRFWKVVCNFYDPIEAVLGTLWRAKLDLKSIKNRSKTCSERRSNIILDFHPILNRQKRENETPRNLKNEVFAWEGCNFWAFCYIVCSNVFWTRLGPPLGSSSEPSWVQDGSQDASETHQKTTSKNNTKKQREIASTWTCLSKWTGSAFQVRELSKRLQIRVK